MKLLLLVLIVFGINCSNVNVYVCASPHATKYHLKATCRGLSNCNYRIVAVSLDSAKKSGKTLCDWEK